MFAEAIEQQLADEQKEIEKMWASPHKIQPQEPAKERAKIDPWNPSPIRKLKEKQAQSVKAAPEFDNNLSFI